MVDEKPAIQEFKLDLDCELRFEVESKNEKVTLEVIEHLFLIETYLNLFLPLLIHIVYIIQLRNCS